MDKASTYTDPVPLHRVQKLYMGGHEIATHTLDHIGNANASQIVGARKWLNEVGRAIVPAAPQLSVCLSACICVLDTCCSRPTLTTLACGQAQTALVPLEKIRGFRGPFLLHNEEQRSILAASGFLYDSTITSVSQAALLHAQCAGRVQCLMQAVCAHQCNAQPNHPQLPAPLTDLGPWRLLP